MKLYLSSYRLGNKKEELKKWIEEHGNKICLIPNAKDFIDDNDLKKEKINKDVIELEELGFKVEVISLSDYFSNQEELYKKLKEFNAFYVIGGNVFTLRKSYYLSGFDKYLETLKNNDNYLYAGYSAGICVLGKTLHGLELCDNPNLDNYNIDPIWTGLNFFDYTFLPHYKSNHKETELIDKVLSYCIENKINYKTLSDGDVIIANI